MTNATIANKEDTIDFSAKFNFGLCKKCLKDPLHKGKKEKKKRATPAVDHTSVDITAKKPNIKPKKSQKICVDKIQGVSVYGGSDVDTAQVL